MFRFLILRSRISSISRASLTTTTTTTIPHVWFLQTQSFKSNSESEKSLITVHYLVNSCGLSLESANSALKKLNNKFTNKADSVLELFKTQGFNDTQIANLFSKSPSLLLSDPDKILKPKIEYFKSLGFSTHLLANLISKQPNLLTRSLENLIVPSCNYIRTLVVTENNVVSTIKNYSRLLNYNLKKVMEPNISILRNHGVPEPNICRWIISFSETLTGNPDRFEMAIVRAKKLELDPTSGKFILAVVMLASCSEMTLQQKIEAYKSFGLSEEDILSAFKLHPLFLRHSEKKIKKLMAFFVTNLNWEPSVVSKNPNLMTYSLEKTIIPRRSVLKVLLSKGLVKEEINVPAVLKSSKEQFFKRFIIKYQDEVPEIVKAYSGG